jgi:hypothetical protein
MARTLSLRLQLRHHRAAESKARHVKATRFNDRALPNCEKQMTLVRSVPSRSSLEVQTFECAACGESKIVETGASMTWIAGRDLRPLD